MNSRYLSRLREALRGRRPRLTQDPTLPEAAVSLVLIDNPNGIEILFIKRSVDERDPWSGQIGLPGGKRDKEDQDLCQTALRETQEETGICLERSALMGQLDDLETNSSRLPPLVIRPFVFAINEQPEISLNSEAEFSFWAPLPELIGSKREVEVTVDKIILQVSAYCPQKHVIWGITYRILEKMFTLLK